MRLVVALGGNALLRRGERLSLKTQRHNMAAAAAALAPILRRHGVVITHGNGPQVGWLARGRRGERFPLDVLDAETEGLLGYLIEQELRNAAPSEKIVTLLSQVVVNDDDPAFDRPDKPIGPVISAVEAMNRRASGETFCEDGGGYRRTVASPAPKTLLELDAVQRLLTDGWVVICAGGGGIPVVEGPDGRWRGVEAVVDKDATSALLAACIDADALMLLTDVAAVYRDWGTDRQQPFIEVTPGELEQHEFAAGSMGPKVAAACRFVRRTGRPAMIGQLTDVAALLAGESGTRILPMPQSSR